jgi:hypothetical protein
VVRVPEKARDRRSAPHRRHLLARVNQRTVAKARNGVIESWVDVQADIAAINSGKAIAQGETYSINGRTYEVGSNGTAYPIAGEGITGWTVEPSRRSAYTIRSGNHRARRQF